MLATSKNHLLVKKSSVFYSLNLSQPKGAWFQRTENSSHLILEMLILVQTQSGLSYS